MPQTCVCDLRSECPHPTVAGLEPEPQGHPRALLDVHATALSEIVQRLLLSVLDNSNSVNKETNVFPVEPER